MAWDRGRELSPGWRGDRPRGSWVWSGRGPAEARSPPCPAQRIWWPCNLNFPSWIMGCQYHPRPQEAVKTDEVQHLQAPRSRAHIPWPCCVVAGAH